MPAPADPQDPLEYQSRRVTPAGAVTGSTAATLSVEQLADLAAAKRRMKAIRRAVRVARFDGYTLAFCATLTLLGVLLSLGGPIASTLIGLALAGGLGAIALVELLGAGRLGKLQPKSPAWLAINQVVLAGLLIAYACWNLLAPSALPTLLPPELAGNADLKAYDLDFQHMYGQLNAILYGTLIAVAVLVQLPMAWFYQRRTRMLAEHLRLTPEWLRDLQMHGVDL